VTSTVIVDIDGTISDVRHRLHHVLQHPKNYEAFHSLCGEDQPIMSVIAAVRAFTSCRDYTAIILLTGRPEKYREATMDWLERNAIPYDSLYMRPDGDHRKAEEYKRGVLGQIQAAGHDVFLAFEDQQDVVDMWRENGIHCLQTQVV
jgi:uncharacterized HAD superfamily protein